jgi:hypothetical protein
MTRAFVFRQHTLTPITTVPQIFKKSDSNINLHFADASSMGLNFSPTQIRISSRRRGENGQMMYECRMMYHSKQIYAPQVIHSQQQECIIVWPADGLHVLGNALNTHFSYLEIRASR